MNTAEHLVELYYRQCHNSLTYTDLKIEGGNNRQFDVLAYSKMQNELRHIEVSVTHRTNWTKNLESLKSDFRFKFKFVNGGGNDLYIDDINLSGSLSIEETEKVYDFKVYPNPVVENLLVSFNSLINLSNPLIEVYDATGRIVKSINLKNISKGENNLEVSSSDLDSGWYILKIISDEKSISTKFLKQ